MACNRRGDGDHDAVEGHAEVVPALARGIGGNRCRGDEHRGWDRLSAVQPFDAAFDTVVLVFLGHVGAGGGFESFQGVGDVDVSVLVVEQPVVVVVQVGEIQDEVTVEVVEAGAVEPDPAFVGGGCCGGGTERPDFMIGGIAGHGDAIARRCRPVRERAVFGRYVLGERPSKNRSMSAPANRSAVPAPPDPVSAVLVVAPGAVEVVGVGVAALGAGSGQQAQGKQHHSDSVGD